MQRQFAFDFHHLGTSNWTLELLVKNKNSEDILSVLRLLNYAYTCLYNNLRL